MRTPYDAALAVVEEHQCPSCVYWDDGCNGLYLAATDDDFWCGSYSRPRRARRSGEPWWMDEDERWGSYGR